MPRVLYGDEDDVTVMETDTEDEETETVRSGWVLPPQAALLPHQQRRRRVVDPEVPEDDVTDTEAEADRREQQRDMERDSE